MEAGGNRSVSELLCHEGESCLDEEEEGGANYEDTCSSSGVTIETFVRDDEFLEAMIERERRMGEWKEVNGGSWDKCARSEAICWILKVHGMRATFGFELQTVYISLMYFDRFLARRSINSDQLWAFRLLSIACLSLAAKMEEIRVPPLSDYQSEDYNFGCEVVQKMELFVLTTLEWKLLSLSPFVFLSHFQAKLCADAPPKDMKRKIWGFILGLMREANLLSYRPSAIAAAAILVALDQSQSKCALESKVYPLQASGFPRFEDVFQCYELMRKLDTEEAINALEKSSNKPNDASHHLRPSSFSGSYMVSSSGRKRRKLQFCSPGED